MRKGFVTLAVVGIASTLAVLALTYATVKPGI